MKLIQRVWGPVGSRLQIAVMLLAMPVGSVWAGGEASVSMSGNDANAGTEAWPFATIAQAVASLGPDGGVVHVQPGVYPQTTTIVLTNGTAVVGTSSNPADVVITRAASVPNLTLFSLGCADALVRYLTVSNGYQSSASGGGMIVSTGTVADCVITSCQAPVGGNVKISSGRLVRCRILNGSSSSQGSGVYASGDAIIENCLIAGSRIACGIMVTGCPRFLNCTVVGNQANPVASWNGGGASFTNCVIAGNTANIVNWNNQSAQSPLFSGCAVDRPLDATLKVDRCLSLSGLVGFQSAADGDYRLTGVSPCVDAGVAYDRTASECDLDGAPRMFAAGPVDIGCFECQRPVRLNSVVATPWQGVLTLTTSFTVTQTYDHVDYGWTFGDGGAASGAAQSHAYSAPGRYDAVITARDRQSGLSISVTNRILVFGPNANEITVYVDGTSRSSRWPYDRPDCAADNVSAAFGVARSLDTLFSVGGTATVSVARGVYPVAAELYITNAIHVVGATGNRDDVVLVGGWGRRLFNVAHAGARVQYVTMTNGWLYWANDDSGAGAGVRLVNGEVADCRITSCRVDHADRGGNVFMSGGRLTRCVIERGTSKGEGRSAGMLYGGIVENCLVANNNQGGFYVAGGSPLVVNCTLACNAGSAMSTWSSGSAYLGAVRNCIMVGSTNASGSAISIQNWGGKGPRFDHCASDAFIPEATACLSNLVLSSFVAVSNGDYRLLPVSPCINAGVRYDGAGAVSETDLDGAPRIHGASVDLGCYEFQGLRAFYIIICDSKGFNVPYEWISAKCGLDENTSESAISNALITAGLNGIPRWASYALGLDPRSASSVLLCDVRQNADPGHVVFSAANANPVEKPELKIEYVLLASMDNLTWTAFPPTETNAVPVGLPVPYRYFRFRTDIILL